MGQAGTIPRYGVKEASQPQNDIAALAEEVRLVGFAVLDSGLSPAEACELADRIEPVIRRQEQEAGGAAALERIGDGNTGRALLAYDEAFLRLAANPRLLALATLLLGEYFVLSQQNSIVLRPGETHGQARYHRDLPYQHFVSSRPLALNALFCADPFTIENGATLVIPASHKHEPFPADTAVRRLEQAVLAPAGSFIVLDAMTFHRSGLNRSDRVRRGVNHVFVLPFLRQQVDLPAMLGGRYAEDPTLRRLLGYDAQTPKSVLEWRRGRLGQV
ncbi:MAG: phytanoyl-CoA dioxygenase family protein [Alphaproteobacteria bacterium]|nr:phytanoyl-CoA dioxygenase family protein [Alphaproteobacteria bacterium]